MKAVLDVKPASGYDDEVAHRYQFPRQYRRVALECVGDWVIFREPQRNGGRRAYVATARVDRVDNDPTVAGLSHAILSDYLPFDAPVPFNAGGRYAEAALREVGDPSQVGIYLRGRSIRAISDADFAAVVRAGLSGTLAPTNAIKLDLDPAGLDAATLHLVRAPVAEQERRVVELLVNRRLREASFRRRVCEAYGDTCAATGLRIVNGGGRSEVQAAHIWPVAEGGPDTVQNGIALSATIHWLFDRHLISLTDDYGLLVSHNKVPSELIGLFGRQLERIRLPRDEALWPSLAYVRRHREAFASC